MCLSNLFLSLKKKKKVFKKDLTVCKNVESFTMQKKSKYCHNVHNVPFLWPVFLCPSYLDFQNSESVI